GVPELPPDLTQESPFGWVRIWHRLEGGKLVSRGEVALSRTRIKTTEYGAFRTFLRQLDQAFSRKLVVSAEHTAQKERWDDSCGCASSCCSPSAVPTGRPRPPTFWTGPRAKAPDRRPRHGRWRWQDFAPTSSTATRSRRRRSSTQH